MSFKQSICITSLGLLGLITNQTVFADTYTLETLGLYDVEHIRDDGYQSTHAYQLNNSGQVTGISERFNEGNDFLGFSAWFYDGVNTTNISLTGDEYTRDDGYRASGTIWLNDAGYAAGSSNRYNGNLDHGTSTWLYDSSSNSTINIGLIDTEHTRDDDFKWSSIVQLNDTDQAIGYSSRHVGGTGLGQSAWLYNGISSINIGLTGVENTRDDGYIFSYAKQLNNSGQVIGLSHRYNGGSNYMGLSTWLYSNGTRVGLGFTGADYTRDDGYKRSSAYKLNEVGQAIGYSQRFNGSTSMGNSAWLYDGTNTINIGLINNEHTRNDGFQTSSAWNLNTSGQVTGHSGRYNGSTSMGTSSWLYDGNNTIMIGLTDAEHTRDDGYKYNYSERINEAGQVTGNAKRYSGSVSAGQSAWLYDGSNTVNIGLTGIEHTRDDDYKYSYASKINESGQVAGLSHRYNGSAELGQSAWFYDDATSITHYNDFSIRATDGYAFSYAGYLGEDGLMLGYYELFDIDSLFLGNRAFGFSLEDGFFDLELQIDGGLELFDWSSLASAVTSNDSGQILGSGKLNGMASDGNAVYLATSTTVVPLPAAFWLFSSGLIGLVGFARRNKA